MKLTILVIYILLLTMGCKEVFEDEYSNKTFTVRTELQSGEGVEVVVWENATDLNYNENDFSYQFYVDDKFVRLDPRGTVIVEEQ